MPTGRTSVLKHADDGLRHLPLYTGAEHSRTRVGVLVGQVCQCGRKGLICGRSGESAGVGVGEVHVCGGWLISKRGIQRGVIDVVALNPFEEHAKAGTDDGSAVPVDVEGEADSWAEAC